MDPQKMSELEGKSSVELLSLIDSYLPIQPTGTLPTAAAADPQPHADIGTAPFSLKDLLTAVRLQLHRDFRDAANETSTEASSIKAGQVIIESVLNQMSGVSARKKRISSSSRKSSALMLEVACELLSATSCLAATGAAEALPAHGSDSEQMLFMDAEVTSIVEVLAASSKKRSRDGDHSHQSQLKSIQRFSAHMHDRIEWLVKRVYLYNNSQGDICSAVNVDDVVNCAWAPFQQLLHHHLVAEENSFAVQNEIQIALLDLEVIFSVHLLPSNTSSSSAVQEREGAGEASRSKMDQLADEASKSMSFVLLLDEGSRSGGSPTAASHLALRRGECRRVPSPETSTSMPITTSGCAESFTAAKQQKQYSIPPPLVATTIYQPGKPDLMLRPLDPNAISPPRSPLMMASAHNTFRAPIGGRTPQTMPKKYGTQSATPTTEVKQGVSGIPAYLLSKKKSKSPTQNITPSFELKSTAIRNRSSGLVDSVYRNDELAALTMSKNTAVLAPATPPMKPNIPTPSEYLVDMPLFVDDDD